MIIVVLVLMACAVGFPTVSQAGLFEQLKEEGKKIQGAIDSIDSVLKSGQGQQRGVPPAQTPSPQPGHRPPLNAPPPQSEFQVSQARMILGGRVVSPQANVVLSKGEVPAMQRDLDLIELGIRPSLFDDAALCFARQYLAPDEKAQFLDNEGTWNGKDEAEKKSMQQRFVSEYRSRMMANAIMPPQRLTIVLPMNFPPYNFEEQRFDLMLLQISGQGGALRTDGKTNQVHVEVRGNCGRIRMSIPFALNLDRNRHHSVWWELPPSEAEVVRQKVSNNQVYWGIVAELGNASEPVPVGTEGGQAQATFVNVRSMPIPNAPTVPLSIISRGLYANQDLERLLKDFNSQSPSRTPPLAQAESTRNEPASRASSETPPGPSSVPTAQAYRKLAGCLAARYLTEAESAKYLNTAVWRAISMHKPTHNYRGNTWDGMADTQFWKGSNEFEAARSKDAFLTDYAGRFGDPDIEGKRCFYGESWSPDK